MSWNAKWISRRQDPLDDLGVFVFRRVLHLDEEVDQFLIRVSADQRYRLYVNRHFVAHGPARGDLQHWFYDTVDIARALEPGENVILALVWNYGRYGPMAQMTARLGFVLDGEGLSTPDGWTVAKLEKHEFAMLHTGLEQVYIDVGPGEVVDMGSGRGPWWAAPLDEGLAWCQPNVICAAEERGASIGGTPWMLTPRQIPAMRYDGRLGVPSVVDLATGTRTPFTRGLEVPAGGLLLDYGELLTAYPRLRIAGPSGARVRVSYMEALAGPGGEKGNRNDVVGKAVVAHQDELILGPDPDAQWESLWWRTYRYLHIFADQPVSLFHVGAVETGYPLEVEASFTGDDASIKPIWDVSVRTAARCAGETYFDCPYYEQLQYAGDTRIQAMIGYYLSSDRRLQRQAIEQFSWSIMPDGMTQSRYPSRQTQVIPPFSLWWVLMVYDQWMYDRVELSAGRLRQMEGVIAAIKDLSGKPEGEQFWTFADWLPEWYAGQPPNGLAAPVHQGTLLLAEIAFAKMAGADLNGLRGQVSAWDFGRHTDEHSQALARICQREVGLPMTPWPKEELIDKCTFYFQYYKHQAMQSADYLRELEPWREMIRQGLTTFAENPEPTRSDCHAWSAHPIVGFFQQIAGVTSAAPGWNRARIEPRPGQLKNFFAVIPHPDGRLVVELDQGQLLVDSPVPYDLIWRDQVSDEGPGIQLFD